MTINFHLRFTMQVGQTLYITGAIPELGSAIAEKAIPMKYLNDEFWFVSIEADTVNQDPIEYHYILKDKDGQFVFDAERSRVVEDSGKDFITIDTWSYAGDPANIFYTAPFKKVFFKEHKKGKSKTSRYTHAFKVKAPILYQYDIVCLLGNTEELGNWNKKDSILLNKEGDWWTAYLDLNITAPIAYKYGVYNTKKKEFISFEEGENRVLYLINNDGQQTLLHDGFVRFFYNAWKGAGVSIPVFSLRSKESFGVGEFNDIKLLADWASKTGLKLIQLLPVNDTTATNSWKDSYPYAAISAFALHPIYINLEAVAGKKGATIIKALSRKQKQLNSLPEVDYETVLSFKINALREVFDLHPDSFLNEEEFISFFETNKHWLESYAAFCEGYGYHVATEGIAAF